jgi:ankyrin repeat protein
VIRVFIDELLSWSKPSKEVFKHYGNQIHDLGKFAYLILHKAVRKVNANIIGFLLDIVEVTEHTDTVNELLLEHDVKGLTARHWAVLSRNIQVSEMVLEWAEKNLMANKLESKLLAGNCNGRNSWHCTAELVRLKVLLKPWEWAKRKITTEEINNDILLATDNDGKTIWHMAAGMENEDLV